MRNPKRHTIFVKVDCDNLPFKYKDQDNSNAEHKHVIAKDEVVWKIQSGSATSLDIYFTKTFGTPFNPPGDHFCVDRNGESQPGTVRDGLSPGNFYDYRVVANLHGPNQCEDDPQIIIDGNAFRPGKNTILLSMLIAAGVGLAIWGVKRLLEEQEE